MARLQGQGRVATQQQQPSELHQLQISWPQHLYPKEDLFWRLVDDESFLIVKQGSSQADALIQIPPGFYYFELLTEHGQEIVSPRTLPFWLLLDTETILHNPYDATAGNFFFFTVDEPVGAVGFLWNVTKEAPHPRHDTHHPPMNATESNDGLYSSIARDPFRHVQPQEEEDVVKPKKPIPPTTTTADQKEEHNAGWGLPIGFSVVFLIVLFTVGWVTYRLGKRDGLQQGAANANAALELDIACFGVPHNSYQKNSHDTPQEQSNNQQEEDEGLFVLASGLSTLAKSRGQVDDDDDNAEQTISFESTGRHESGVVAHSRP